MVKSVATSLLTLLFAVPAYADNEEAARLFEQGRTQKENGELAAACESFGDSYALERAAGTALNLAECEERGGNWEYALELYEGAAKTFAESERMESAKFARERAAALRAAHATKPLDTPKTTKESPKPKTWLLGVGIGGVAIGAIGLVGLVYSYGVIKDFENGDFSGEVLTDGRSRLDEEDCGKVQFSGAATQSKFEDACSAHARAQWLLPVTFAGTVVGVTSLAYYFYTRPKKRSSMAIVPTASGGVLATFEW